MLEQPVPIGLWVVLQTRLLCKCHTVFKDLRTVLSLLDLFVAEHESQSSFHIQYILCVCLSCTMCSGSLLLLLLLLNITGSGAGVINSQQLFSNVVVRVQVLHQLAARMLNEFVRILISYFLF